MRRLEVLGIHPFSDDWRLLTTTHLKYVRVELVTLSIKYPGH